MMNRYLLFACALSACPLLARETVDEFQVVIEPKWEDLENSPQKTVLFGGKWILVGSITFKKKAKTPVNLTRLYLHWNGQCIDQLLGSLYKKIADKDFIPVEEHLVCDGLWNKTKQQLMLQFNEKESLGPINTYYLVLTVPPKLEPVIREGQFKIEKTILPEPFRVSADENNLQLTLDILGSTAGELSQETSPP